MTKRFLSLLLSVVLILSMLSTVAFADVTGAGTYDDPWLIGKTTPSDIKAYISGTTLYINGTGAMTNFDSGSNKTPWYDSRTDIKTAVISSGVTSIGNCAFYDCNITSVTIPEGVTSIGNNAFYHCESLKSITFPKSVTSIGMNAFNSCSALTSVTIPEGVTSIGAYAFANCRSLAEIIMKPTNPPTLGYQPFMGCSKLANIYVPAGSVEAYKAAANWKNYADKIFAAYYINVATPTNGTVTVSPTDFAASGTDITVIATPDEGYKLKSLKWYVSGTDAASATDITETQSFTMPSGDVIVEAEFKEKTVEITVPTGLQMGTYKVKVDGKEVSPDSGILGSNTYKIPVGHKLEITLVPADGFRVIGKDTYTVNCVTENTVVRNEDLPQAEKIPEKPETKKSTSSVVIEIGKKAEENKEQNPNTGAPAMRIASAIVLAGAALVASKKHNK